MDQVRSGAVAHHIYRVDGTGEELIIDDRIMLSLRRSGAGELEQLLAKYHLQYVRKVGNGHVVRVTAESGGLISPEGFVARLHDMQGGSSDNLQAKYSSVDPG